MFAATHLVLFACAQSPMFYSIFVKCGTVTYIVECFSLAADDYTVYLYSDALNCCSLTEGTNHSALDSAKE